MDEKVSLRLKEIADQSCLISRLWLLRSHLLNLSLQVQQGPLPFCSLPLHGSETCLSASIINKDKLPIVFSCSLSFLRVWFTHFPFSLRNLPPLVRSLFLHSIPLCLLWWPSIWLWRRRWWSSILNLWKEREGGVVIDRFKFWQIQQANITAYGQIIANALYQQCYW